LLPFATIIGAPPRRYAAMQRDMRRTPPSFDDEPPTALMPLSMMRHEPTSLIALTITSSPFFFHATSFHRFSCFAWLIACSPSPLITITYQNITVN